MTEPKSHTSGPWNYRPNKHDDWGFVRCDSGHLVACARSGESIEDGRVLDEHRRIGTDPYEANARLIAAAPELLAAAEMLEDAEDKRQHCEECEGEGEPEACEVCFPFFDDARVARRLAIEKARGHGEGTKND